MITLWLFAVMVIWLLSRSRLRALLFLWAGNHKMFFYFYGVKLRLFSRKYSKEKKTIYNSAAQAEIRTLDSMHISNVFLFLRRKT